LGRALGKANKAEMFFQMLNKFSAIIMWGVAVYLLLHLLKQSLHLTGDFLVYNPK
jgi:hypothetical protein